MVALFEIKLLKVKLGGRAKYSPASFILVAFIVTEEWGVDKIVSKQKGKQNKNRSKN